MKLLCSILFLFIVFTSCNKNSNQAKKETSSFCLDTILLKTNIQESLLSIFFLNGRDGFIAGNEGGIYKTRDSAKNWVKLNATINLPIYSLFFIDSLKGFAVGGQSSCGGTGCIPPGGFILRTLDGGQTWSKVYTPTDKIQITSICFVDSLTGFCVGDNSILKTSDGGQTWSQYQVNNLGGIMMQVKFIDTQKGFIICTFGKIIKTEDGGVTWSVTTPLLNTGYYSLSATPGAIYVSGQGKIIKSTNGGDSWSELANSPIDIFALYFIDNNNGFAFGRGNYSGGDFGYSYGSMYCTNDGGVTWNGSSDIKQIVSIQAVSFPTKNIGYLLSWNTITKLISR